MGSNISLNKGENDKKKIEIEKVKININDLNTDCLAAIFSYLPIRERLYMSKVCKKWRDASQLSWYDTKSLNLCDRNFIKRNFKKNHVDQPILENILKQCGSHLKKLTLNGKYDSSIITVIREYCYNLIEFKIIIFKKYNEQYFLDAFINMKNLKNIVIQYDTSSDQSYSKNDIKILQSLPKEIESISICSSFSEPWCLAKNFAGTLVKFNSLQGIELCHWCLDDYVMEILSEKKTLIQLNLRGCKLSIKGQLSILKLSNLTHLNLSGTEGIVNDIILKIVKNCNQLNHLNLSALKKINNTTIREIVLNCKNLRYLNISKCSEISREALVELKNLKYLNELVMNDIYKVEDTHLQEFHNLKTLECAYSVKVTDTGIIKFLQQSPDITRLNLCHTGITSVTIKFVSSDMMKIRENNHQKLHLTASSRVLNLRDLNQVSSFLIIEKCCA